MSKIEYNGDKGIEIVFKDYKKTLDGELVKHSPEYIQQLKKEGKPLKDWIDPVWEIEEDEDSFIVSNASHDYKYLKSEIGSYSFYDTES